jgi:PAS domain S-box-containing protein
MATTKTSHTSNYSTAWYLLILAFIITAVTTGGFSYVRQQNQIEINDATHDLRTVSDLKATQIAQWRRERLQEANSIHANAMLAHRVNDYLNNKDKNRALEEIHNWISTLYNQSGYSGIMLFHPDGRIITTVSKVDNHHLAHYQAIVAETARQRDIIFSDFHRDNETGIVDIDISIPIMYQNSTHSACIAVLLIDINPYRYLYPSIRHWPTPSQTAEALLVRRDGNDVLFLSQLRHQQDPVLTFRVPLSDKNMPAVRAALGQEGVFEGIDYRGTPVVAAVRKIADSPWSIITKIDIKEILEPVVERTRHVEAICLSIIIAIILAICLGWSRKKSSYLMKQYEAEMSYSQELKQTETLLQDANNLLEERVATRTEELSNSNTQLRQEVTERKQVEELLRKQFKAIQQSPVAIVITELDGTIEFVNPKFSEYCGYAYDEVIGQNPRILKTEVTSPEVHKQLWETIAAGKIWEGDFCNRKKNGELFWEHAKILPIKNQSGIITNYMAFKEDITIHRQLEEKLVQARKLETIGQIAGGVAHEVRNPLNAILSITEALFREEQLENNAEFTPYIQHIRTQVNRLANLMNDLLDLGKPILSENIQAAPLLEHCQQTMELWKVSGMAKNREVTITSPEGAASIRVMADAGRLQQVIFNLLENAGNHSPAGSTITLHLPQSVPNSEMAEVRIVDTGRGIPDESLSRIFEPFYSDRKGGTGLGLSLVKHFIENMGGTVRIWNNTPTPGCTAELSIPLAKKEQT